MSDRNPPGMSQSDTDVLLRASVDCVDTNEEYYWFEKHREIYQKMQLLVHKASQITTKINSLNPRAPFSKIRHKYLSKKEYKTRMKIHDLNDELATIEKNHLSGVIARAREIELKAERVSTKYHILGNRFWI